MVRLLIRIGISLVASAVGLVIAAAVLEGVTLNTSGFLTAVALFTVTTGLVQPLIIKMTLQNASALMGASALITTFIGLLVTTLVSDGLQITGLDSWFFATMLVWLVVMLAMILLPFILVKAGVQALRDDRGR